MDKRSGGYRTASARLQQAFAKFRRDFDGVPVLGTFSKRFRPFSDVLGMFSDVCGTLSDVFGRPKQGWPNQTIFSRLPRPKTIFFMAEYEFFSVYPQLYIHILVIVTIRTYLLLCFVFWEASDSSARPFHASNLSRSPWIPMTHRSARCLCQSS